MTEFSIRAVHERDGSCTVEISEHPPRKPFSPTGFAKTNGPSLEVALRMAVPYMVAVSEADPLVPPRRPYAVVGTGVSA